MALKKRRPARPEPFVWLDGRYIHEAEPFLNLSDFQTASSIGFTLPLHAYGTTARHIDRYYERLVENLRLGKLYAPLYLTEEAFGQAITDLLNKNRMFRSVAITAYLMLRYEVDTIGLQIPTTSLMLTCRMLEASGYPLHPKAYVNTFRAMRRPLLHWDGIAWIGDPLRWYAMHFAQRKGDKTMLLINDENRVVGTPDHTLYILPNGGGGALLTPPIEDGAVYDPIREIVPLLLRELGLTVEEQPLSEADVESAEEVFLASTVDGFIPLVGVNFRRFTSSLTARLTPLLNHSYFPEQDFNQ
ncbi:MAG: hypothetical protein CSA97_03475 [Bacteroidetes bacterium]|nr:MAG: hypothetical protein CSA97_03475 [Bacteroidota bacterium]